MGSTSARQPLGYFDLPPEIRLQILESTDLNPVPAQSVLTFGYVPIWRGRLRIPEDWCKKTNPLCNSCARNASSNTYCLHRRFGPNRASDKLGKIYSRRPGFRWMRTRRCRSIPFNLFSVNKQMRAEVEYTFLKFNGLEFFPPMALDVCQYLSGRTGEQLQLIRDLRFTFSREQLQVEYWNERCRNDWRLLLNWIKHNDNLRNLRVVIDADSHISLPECLFPYEEYGFEDNPAYISFYQILCEIALELVAIRGKLQGLHLRLPYLRQLEKLLEKEVMGSEYDGYQGFRLWQTLERRSPDDNRLPPGHPIAWDQLTSRYRKLAAS